MELTSWQWNRSNPHCVASKIAVREKVKNTRIWVASDRIAWASHYFSRSLPSTLASRFSHSPFYFPPLTPLLWIYIMSMIPHNQSFIRRRVQFTYSGGASDHGYDSEEDRRWRTKKSSIHFLWCDCWLHDPSVLSILRRISLKHAMFWLWSASIRKKAGSGTSATDGGPTKGGTRSTPSKQTPTIVPNTPRDHSLQ